MQVKSIAECSKGEQSAILSTFIKLPFVIKIFVLSIFEWPLYTDFTTCNYRLTHKMWYLSNKMERSGSVVECLTRDRVVAGSSLTVVTALWSSSKTHLS